MKTLIVLALLGTTVLSSCAVVSSQEETNSQLVNFSLFGDNIAITADVRIGEKIKSEAFCDPYELQRNKKSVSFSPMYEPSQDGFAFSARTSWFLSSDLDEVGKDCVTKAMIDGVIASNADFVVSPRYTIELVKNKPEKKSILFSSNEKLKATVRFYPGYYTNIRKAVVGKSKNKESCIASNCKLMLPVAAMECEGINGKNDFK